MREEGVEMKRKRDEDHDVRPVRPRRTREKVIEREGGRASTKEKRKGKERKGRKRKCVKLARHRGREKG